MTRRDIRITKNFWLHEFEVSAARPDLIESVPDDVSPYVIELAVRTLQPLRNRIGRIDILSGYRPEKLNKAVGGSPTSQHRYGQAADIRAKETDTAALFGHLRRSADEYALGQVIHYPASGFVHVALPNDRYDTPTFFEVRNGKLQRV